MSAKTETEVTQDIAGASTENYRARVAAIRRENTRNRLIESALGVFAEKGPDGAMIDDFIAAAGVARGTFYNYFRTTGELLSAVAAEVSDEVLAVIDPVVRQFDDPAMRMAVGCRLFMHMAVRYPLWGAFITRVGTRRGSRGRRLDAYMTRDLEVGIAQGRFVVPHVEVARDLALGALVYGIGTMLRPGAPDDYPEQVILAVLRALGVAQAEAVALATAPLPKTDAPQGVVFERIAANPQPE
ncbi:MULTISPECIES: TetR/AcrR family transcriptional regulator [unclassified Cupriavidus]|uniref:TetR/AcrR family transcriptional regulator n=1 Tax=unclassified Cupriavidus TaxID=2640874 RepID=UPI001C00055A|nr:MULTISPECIES: TetR/AcrR family transcriptional regulator [unclassified Cupriavidus]MCA3185477.1 TetR/AcrR family transcriptional regulator [Cupriavidus sp.]MCA3191947.1 TetR/AcrR family transcriptional regulator [Cupriavidus sp.]MCA3197692.1 TetR/AcrR family transcriptional regulator [Cupriavidus sp.]MCA3202744.1 TetR/AcrR family transcriptional regulator [Cupriavidus sp.]MCA3207914.1 TetR/AcrR family transcriptional regulator [Cupriavidus sp.]